MPENGSVGGVGGGGSSAGSRSAGKSESQSDKSSSSSTSTSGDSGKSSPSTADALASSPTTADSLAGGQAARPDASSSDTKSTLSGDPDKSKGAADNKSANDNAAPAAGTGSLDAAVTQSQNTAAAAQASKAEQESVTPDSPPPTFDSGSTNSTPATGVQTPESQTSAASIGASITEGGINAVKDHVDRTGRSAAAATLTRGNAGNLPATGYANRADLAKTITAPATNAASALDASPYGPKAVSTQQLTSAAQKASNFGKAAGIVGTAVGPIVGAYEGYHGAPQQATTGERIANMIGGGLKEIDDAAVSAGAGTLAGAGTIATAGLLAAGGVTAPAAPAVAASTPAVATAAAIGASTYYDGTTVDAVIDDAVDNYVEPAIAATVDTAIGAYEAAESWLGGVADKVRSWF